MRRRSLQPLSEHQIVSKIGCISTSRYTKLATPVSKSMAFELTDIYFNEESRRLHIRNIIDSYFDSGPGELLAVKLTDNLPSPIPTMRRRSSLITRTAR
jgi:hypothetical protein